jgi:hypothetical protein
VRTGIDSAAATAGEPALTHEWFRPRLGPTDRIADTFADMVLDGLVPRLARFLARSPN